MKRLSAKFFGVFFQLSTKFHVGGGHRRYLEAGGPGTADAEEEEEEEDAIPGTPPG